MLIDPSELIVDGERVEPENATITLHGDTYGLSDLEDQDEDKWEFVGPTIKEGEPASREDGRGRPRREEREVLNGILFRGGV